MTKARRNFLIFIAAAVPLAAAAILLTGDFWRSLASHFPECVFYRSTGYLCPACGNTRSVLALLELDIPAALGYNITPPLLLLGGVLLYAELMLELSGRKIKLIPRNAIFWIIFGCAMMGYYVLRNI